MQSSETADLVEKLEDAQMVLASMASNRYGAPFRTEIVAWLGKLGIISEQVPSRTHHEAHIGQESFMIAVLQC